MEDLDITPCLAHPMGYDSDCDYCVAEARQLEKTYQGQVKRNEQKASLLGAQGGGLDNVAVMAYRLDMILGMIFAQNPKSRVRFEIDFARHMFASLEECEAEMNKAKLMRPGKVVRKG